MSRSVIYDFRPTFATREAEAGMKVPVIAALLGHGDLRSVMKYVHVRRDAMDQAMKESAERALRAILGHLNPVKRSF